MSTTTEPTARLHRLLIPLAALVAITPLLVQGPSCGHDFDFHLLSWLEACTQLTHGAFPHWAFTPAWNAGEPRFLFYPPLSWLLGAVLGIVLPWTLVPAALTWLTLTLAGLSMHRLARPYLNSAQAILAATLYLTNPYMLFTAYERTAYGELLAAAFIPLLLAAALAPRLKLLPIAAPIALIWLANAPAGVMSCYALAFLTAVRLLSTRSHRRRQAATVAGATILGLALAGAYLLPAALEQHLISTQLAVVEGMRIQDNFPFHPMAASPHTSAADAALHNAVLLQASHLAAVLFAVILLAALLTRRRPPATEPFPTRTLLAFTALIALLLTPPALPLWNLLPELRFLQFPWRLLALITPVFALFLARLLPSHPASIPVPPRLTLAFAALTLTASLTASCWRLYHQPCDDEDAVPARVALYHSNLGTDATDEYTPAGADEDAFTPGDPPFWLAAQPTDPPPAASHPGQAPADLTLTLPTPRYLILNRHAFALWHLRLNGHSVPADDTPRPDGLIAIPLPAGRDHIVLYQQSTPIENTGLALTCTAGLLSLALWRKTSKAPAKNPQTSSDEQLPASYRS